MSVNERQDSCTSDHEDALSESEQANAVEDKPYVTGEAKTSTARSNPAKKVAFWVLIVIVLLVGWYAATDRLAPSSSSGAVSGYLAQLTPRVAGQVTEVLVSDGDIVDAGTPLFRLDPRVFELAVREAEASFAQALQSNEASAAGVVSSQAGVTQARANLENVSSSANRTLTLADRGLISAVEADNARAALRSAEADLARAEANLKSALLQLGERGTLNPEVRAAQVRIEQAQLNLQFSVITAPTRGAVTNLRLAIGQYVSPGTPALTFFDARGAWITADLRENQLGNVQPGDEVDILFDAAPGQVFAGKVQSIAWGIDPGRTTAGGLMQNQAQSEWFEPARSIPIHIELNNELANWPTAVRAGGKVSVVVYAEGKGNPIAWLSSVGLRIRSYLSYLY